MLLQVKEEMLGGPNWVTQLDRGEALERLRASGPNFVSRKQELISANSVIIDDGSCSNAT